MREMFRNVGRAPARSDWTEPGRVQGTQGIEIILIGRAGMKSDREAA